MSEQKILRGDCLSILPTLEDNSVDLVCSDPPYGISFMGREWDKAVPSVDVWRECLRVLKPGGLMFIMSSPRMDVLVEMGKRIQEAGFRTDFSPIYWAYATGFPKAHNVGKIVDKRLGAEREVIGYSKGVAVEDSQGYGGIARGATGVKQTSADIPVTVAASDEAKALDGSYGGFQPKPAVEVIIVAMKPLSEKGYVDQALENRKGITWLDDCRIPLEADSRLGKGGSYSGNRTGSNAESAFNAGNGQVEYTEPPARFPANLLVSDNAIPTESGGAAAPVKTGQKGWGGEIYGKFASGGDDGRTFYSQQETDKSFSRYFSLDRWWERRIGNLPEAIQQVFPFLVVPKASKSEKNKGCEDLPEKEIGHNRFDHCATCGGTIFQNPDRPSACKCPEPVRKHNTVKGNHHPTVKPIALMSYLVTLGSREGDVVLDPFVGSGTTAVACKLLDRNCFGVELDDENADIAEARLNGWEPEEPAGHTVPLF